MQDSQPAELPNLEETLKEIEEHLRQEQIAVFYGDDRGELNYIAEVWWSEDRPDWREFIKAAKEAGTKVIIIQFERLDEEMLESIPSDKEQTSKTIRDLKEHIGEIGQFFLFWIREGVKYTYCQLTPWRSELDNVLSEMEVPLEIEEKSPEELSKEFVDYIEQEHPDLDADFLPTEVKKAFWKKKGLGASDIFGSQEIDEEIEEKVETVEELAMEIWKQRVKQKEKKIVPRLVEEFDEWARENGLRGISRSNLNAFLGEKEVFLSPDAHDRVYSRVSLLLRKMNRKEKELLPRLVKECCEWAKEEELTKVTRTHISEFLDQKGQNLSYPARDSLLRKVVISLKRLCTTRENARCD